MNLGESIYNLRTKNNMSQGDLANTLDVSRQSVSKWETNTSVPELDKLVKMSVVFNISLDELIRGEKGEDVQHETAASDIRAPQSLPARKIVGLFVLGFGLVAFLLLSLLGDLLFALFLSSPLFVCALICLTVNKHTALWCCWVLYASIYAYLRYATGIRLWWIFHGWLYRSGLEIHAVIAWLQALGFIALIISTGRLFYKGRKSSSG
ncbi:helix-turn-helix domain-containing protein [Desulfitobacterium chlororespirans]|uniref:DNA-binding transcriptional regulator, XRE-family HTH domain n=1 Tax=Desulfitobacterium chlororespirans DSM 11544 TaxID=1121395 RepID=A0A1M7UG99_9FIRM|nr:helix-turn-helix transcriptional regulator [Desulfitobacterium chlororespirans]SHN82022.1 DNA-binding transcriptional regulator, XRE-family HTH domain [Desulfitobacterium chlororespirans DSM 11544]